MRKGTANLSSVSEKRASSLTDGPGPYATAILRFYISFPDTFPALPPLVTFSTDIFHPLITPLSTYMYTTDIQEGGTVSATDEERLPPGGFSLRHGFPSWFGRGSRGRQRAGHDPSTLQTPPRSSRSLAGGGRDSNSSTPNSKIAASDTSPPSAGRGAPGTGGTVTSSASAGSRSFMDVHKRDISAFEVLSYIRSSFDDEGMLDSVPLEAAGNPGAWHAWRSHRGYNTLPEGDPSARKPGEWNWEGVWEERVKKGIAASLSEPVLYGGVGGGDDTVSGPRLSNSTSPADVASDPFLEHGGLRGRDGQRQPLQNSGRVCKSRSSGRHFHQLVKTQC